MPSDQHLPGSVPDQLAQGGSTEPGFRRGRINQDVAWNIALNGVSKAQSLTVLVAGYVVGRLGGVGIASTAMASCYLGAALADFGLASEMGRLSVTESTRRTVHQCQRALAMQAPAAVILAPAIFYLALGRRVGTSFFMLGVIGLLAACLTSTAGLVAVLNGLLDFKAPAACLGITRLLSCIAAVAGVLIHPGPAVIIAAFLVAEAISVIALAIALRHRSAQLPAVHDPKARILRTHVWLGASSVINILTNQSDTILVASILTPQSLGLFSIASQLQNGVGTIALASSTPVSLRAVSEAVRGRSPNPLLQRASVTAGGVAITMAVGTWLIIHFGASLFAKIAVLGTSRSEVVLAVCLIAAIPSAIGGLYLAVSIGYGAHRAVGTARMITGLIAAGCIIAGALLLGVVGAAIGTLVRDGMVAVVGRKIVVSAGESRAFRGTYAAAEA